MWKTLDENILASKKVAELKEIARTFGLPNYQKMKKAELIQALMKDDDKDDNKEQDKAEPQVKEKAESEVKEKAEPQEQEEAAKKNGKKAKPSPDRSDRFEVEGILELSDSGFGFLRFNNFLTSE